MAIGLALLGAGSLSACARETRLSVVLEAGGAGTDAVAFELEVRTGPCPNAEDFALGRAGGVSIAQQSFTPGSGMSLGPIDAGTYSFVALGRRDDCTPVLFGCVERDVGDGDIRIPVNTPSWTSAERCPSAASCAAGECRGPLDAGPADAGPDADPGDAGPQDGGADGSCRTNAECGPISVTECVESVCRPRTPTLRTMTDHASNPFSRPLSLAWAPNATGIDIYLGIITGAVGSRAAFIESLPLDRIDDIGSLMIASPSSDASVIDVTSLDIRTGEGEGVKWAMSGDSGSDMRVVWIGTLRMPGGDPESSALSSAEPTTPLGPDLMVGGETSGGGVQPIHFVTRTLQNGPGTASMGGVREGMASMGAYIPMGGTIPTGLSLRGSGSAGSWLVMEQERDGDLLLWPLVLGTRDSPIPFQPVTRTGSGRPTLAHLGDMSYVLAYPSGNGVSITAMECDRTCVFDSATELPIGDTVSHAAIVEMPDAAFVAMAVVEPVDPTSVIIRGAVFDPDAGVVGQAGDRLSFDMLTLDVGNEVHALSTLTVTEGTTLHLIVAALVGPPAGADDLVIADAAFTR